MTLSKLGQLALIEKFEREEELKNPHGPRIETPEDPVDFVDMTTTERTRQRSTTTTNSHHRDQQQPELMAASKEVPSGDVGT